MEMNAVEVFPVAEKAASQRHQRQNFEVISGVVERGHQVFGLENSPQEPFVIIGKPLHDNLQKSARGVGVKQQVAVVVVGQSQKVNRPVDCERENQKRRCRKNNLPLPPFQKAKEDKPHQGINQEDVAPEKERDMQESKKAQKKQALAESFVCPLGCLFQHEGRTESEKHGKDGVKFFHQKHKAEFGGQKIEGHGLESKVGSVHPKGTVDCSGVDDDDTDKSKPSQCVQDGISLHCLYLTRKHRERKAP